MIVELFKTLLDIALLRKGPQDLPRASALLALSIVAAFSVTAIYAGIAGIALDMVLARSVVGALFMSACAALVLYLAGQRQRLVQTLSAMFGVSVVIGLLEIVLVSVHVSGASEAIVAVGYLAALAWSLLIDGHIYRNAIDVSLANGCALAMAIFLPQAYIVQMIGAVN